jgi:hypothetical protein
MLKEVSLEEFYRLLGVYEETKPGVTGTVVNEWSDEEGYITEFLTWSRELFGVRKSGNGWDPNTKKFFVSAP